MDDQFDSKGGEQNIGQGDHAIGKQVNIFTQPLKPKTVVIASVLAAAVLGASLAGWHLLAPAGKSASTIGNNAPAIIAEKGNVAVTYNTSGVPPEVFAKYVTELGATEQIVNGFFGTLLKEKVPRDQWDSKLREIATQYKELLHNWEAMQSTDPQVVKLKAEAKQAIDAGDYANAEELLNQADALNLQAIEQQEKTTKQRRIFAAETNANQARLQRIQLRYAKAAAYWQKAAALLPEDSKKERAEYLDEGGEDLHRLSRYTDALSLYMQSLSISREIVDKEREGSVLDNIGRVYDEQSDYTTALKYFEQSLSVSRKINDKKGKGSTLNNIGHIYDERGDYATALKYFEQSLMIMQDIGDKEGEGASLNNIGEIYKVTGDYTTALKYLEQSLRISRETSNKIGEATELNNIGTMNLAKGDYAVALRYLEQSLDIRRQIGDKTGEGVTLNNLATTVYAKKDLAAALMYLKQSLDIMEETGNKAEEAVINSNIGMIYKKQGNLSKAEPYISRAVQLAEEISSPDLEEYRKASAELRAKLKER